MVKNCPFSKLPCREDCELMFGDHCVFVAMAEDLSDRSNWVQRLYYLVNDIDNQMRVSTEK